MTFVYCGRHELTLEDIRKKHLPEENYRISSLSYRPGVSFSGSSRKGLVYVLSGQCEISIPGMKVLKMSSGEYAELKEDSSYSFNVIGETKVTIVKVWCLPEIVKFPASRD